MYYWCCLWLRGYGMMPYPPTDCTANLTTSPPQLLLICTAPTSCPNSASTWFILSMRSVCLPCSSSRTKRSPTPDFSAKSTCVRLNMRRRSFTNAAIDVSIYIIIPFRVQIYIIYLILHPKGYSFLSYHGKVSEREKIYHIFQYRRNLHITSTIQTGR